MDDLKVPVTILLLILAGAGYFFYNKKNNPTPKFKPTKNIVETVPEKSEADIKAEKAEALAALKKQSSDVFKSGDYTETLKLIAGKEDSNDYQIQKMFGYSYAASKEYDKSYEYFQKAFSIIEKCGDDSLYSSYYNNMALLHQENDKFEDAANCLKKALYIAEDKMHDDIRTAITRTNLASTYLRLKRLEEAEECLKGAIKIFEGRNPSDFHYCAALSALADLCLLRGQFEESVNYFEMALSEIDFHMGENNFYSIVEDNLDKAMELLARKKTMDKGREVSKESFRKIKGLELSKKYFEAFGKPILLKNFYSSKNNTYL